MNRKPTGLFETWLRGGQTVGHNFEMTLEVIGKLLLFAIAPWTFVCSQLANLHVPPDAEIAVLSMVEAWIAKTIGWPFPSQLTITAEGQDPRVLSLDAIMSDPDIHARAVPLASTYRGRGAPTHRANFFGRR